MMSSSKNNQVSNYYYHRVILIVWYQWWMKCSLVEMTDVRSPQSRSGKTQVMRHGSWLYWLGCCLNPLCFCNAPAACFNSRSTSFFSQHIPSSNDQQDHPAASHKRSFPVWFSMDVWSKFSWCLKICSGTRIFANKQWSFLVVVEVCTNCQVPVCLDKK